MISSLPATAGRLYLVLWTVAACAPRHRCCFADDDGGRSTQEIRVVGSGVGLALVADPVEVAAGGRVLDRVHGACVLPAGHWRDAGSGARPPGARRRRGRGG